jgi:peptidoglycan/xylan/chitin deacetylase (PgdA/CDA1 family)
MRADETICLMYHEIETPGRPLCQSEPGYVRYVVTEDALSQQICYLQKEGMRGVSISQALSEPVAKNIVITFDDGCASDLTVAIPVLRDAGFGATFYITLGFLGRPGYLRPEQVREIAGLGFEVGCHSMTHAYLSDLDEAGVRREMQPAKLELEEMIGGPVYHFSCPGGRWSPRVARVARECGYRSVATSRLGTNGPRSDPFQLARVAVMRDTAISDFEAMCHGRNLWRRKIADFGRVVSRRLLGNSLYDRLRQRALEK